MATPVKIEQSRQDMLCKWIYKDESNNIGRCLKRLERRKVADLVEETVSNAMVGILDDGNCIDNTNGKTCNSLKRVVKGIISRAGPATPKKSKKQTLNKLNTRAEVINRRILSLKWKKKQPGADIKKIDKEIRDTLEEYNSIEDQINNLKKEMKMKIPDVTTTTPKTDLAQSKTKPAPEDTAAKDGSAKPVNAEPSNGKKYEPYWPHRPYLTLGYRMLPVSLSLYDTEGSDKNFKRVPMDGLGGIRLVGGYQFSNDTFKLKLGAAFATQWYTGYVDVVDGMDTTRKFGELKTYEIGAEASIALHAGAGVYIGLVLKGAAVIVDETDVIPTSKVVGNCGNPTSDSGQCANYTFGGGQQTSSATVEVGLEVSWRMFSMSLRYGHWFARDSYNGINSMNIEPTEPNRFIWTIDLDLISAVEAIAEAI